MTKEKQTFHIFIHNTVRLPQIVFVSICQGRLQQDHSIFCGNPLLTMETPVINKIPLVRKTLMYVCSSPVAIALPRGWIILGVIYICIVLFTSIESESIPETIAIAWDDSQMPTTYMPRVCSFNVEAIWALGLLDLPHNYSLDIGDSVHRHLRLYVLSGTR